MSILARLSISTHLVALMIAMPKSRYMGWCDRDMKYRRLRTMFLLPPAPATGAGSKYAECVVCAAYLTRSAQMLKM